MSYLLFVGHATASYQKLTIGRVWGFSLANANEDDEADWAEVRIEYASLDGSVNGAYTAKVETCGTVMTQWRSGEEHRPEPVKQYHVT